MPTIDSFIAACEWSASYYLIFSDNVFVPLIYYSHLGVIIPTIAIVILIYLSNKNSLVNKLLLLMILCFSGWVFADLVLWATEFPSYVMFFWSIEILLEPLVYFFAFYFSYVFYTAKDLSIRQKFLISLPLIPTFLLVTTDLALIDFDLTNCDRAATEGYLATYGYIIELFYVLAIGYITLKQYLLKRTNVEEKRKILLLGSGVILFLLSFSLGNILEVFTENWLIGQYGLFGAPVFTAFLAYLIVKYKAFDVKLIAAQVLVASLWFLILAILFLRSIETVRIVVIISLFFILILGTVLVRSVVREIKQREKIELLAGDLEKANVRLKELDKQKSEFVSIASHQLRSPLTAMRGYASMLVEGSFGQLPKDAQEAVERIEKSSKLMIASVEDYLNVSRIESGNMKYNLSDFNLREMANTICDDIRPEAMKKGLILLCRSNISGDGMVNADVGKTNQIIHNLINNSLKYTQKGSINVFVHDDMNKKRIYIDITDTGIGMNDKTRHTLFQKFNRADNANSVNVSGTGLGLYVALKMAEAMGGTINATSEGDNKGSTFTFELPLVVTK